jgi:hypothetical protein
VEDARNAVKAAAPISAEGVAGPGTADLVTKLEKMTGVSISELAVHAEDWPDV